MSLTAIRGGMATRLATISGLRAHATWPDQLEPPFALVEPPAGTYHQTFEIAETRYNIDVIVGVGLAGGLPRAQEALDAYLSPTGSSSIKLAVEGDQTLGGTAETAVALGWDKPAALIINDLTYYGTTIHFEVLGT